MEYGREMEKGRGEYQERDERRDEEVSFEGQLGK
jgi:hypothetical protein